MVRGSWDPGLEVLELGSLGVLAGNLEDRRTQGTGVVVDRFIDRLGSFM